MVIVSLSVCKGICMKDCIKVQSVVFQMIVDNISLMGVFHSGEMLPENFSRKWWHWREPFNSLIHCATQCNLIASLFPLEDVCISLYVIIWYMFGIKGTPLPPLFLRFLHGMHILENFHGVVYSAVWYISFGNGLPPFSSAVVWGICWFSPSFVCFSSD